MILVLAGGAILPVAAVAASTRMSARMKRAGPSLTCFTRMRMRMRMNVRTQVHRVEEVLQLAAHERGHEAVEAPAQLSRGLVRTYVMTCRARY